MKKYIFVQLLLACLFFSGCNNEAIDVESVKTPEPFVNISYSVSTSGTYDPFGIDDYKALLSSDYNNSIGVFTYVYDANGNRVDSLFSYSKTFSQVQQNFQLPKGNYTFVTFETLVNADYDYESDYWTFVNTEKLNTAEIRKKNMNSMTMDDAVVGMSTKFLNVTNNQSENVAPEPLGSIIDVQCTNFSKSKYSILMFLSKNTALGFKFNPSLSGDERYDWRSYNKDNYYDIRWGVKDNVKLDYLYNVKLYVLEECTQVWLFGGSTQQADLEDEISFDRYPKYDYGNSLRIEKGKKYYAGAFYLDLKNDVETYFGDDYYARISWWLDCNDSNKESSTKSINLNSNKGIDSSSRRIMGKVPFKFDDINENRKLIKLDKQIN